MTDPSHFPDPDSSPLEDPALSERVAELVDRLRRGESVELDGDDPYAEELRRLLPTIQKMAAMFGPTACDAEPGPLGDFRPVRKVGHGGMGIVYEAVQVSLGRRVALKILPDAAAIDDRRVQRFEREAQAAASLHHPSIVTVFANGVDRGTPFYAMQFIDGKNLAQVIGGWNDEADASAAKARDRCRIAAELCLQAAEGLAYAHGKGVIHRDVKPSNLMVDDAGHLWITDFGLAHIQSGHELTRTNDSLGTARYMSPEQVQGRRVPLDGRTDVYSLGATLYEMLTLRPVFEGDDRVELLRNVMEADPPPPRQVDPRIPRDLETIVLKATSKNRADRYADAAAMAEDLRRFLAWEPILARRPTTWRRARSFARRRPVLLVSLAAAVAIAGMVGLEVRSWKVRNAEAAAAQDDRERKQREIDGLQRSTRRSEALKKFRSAESFVRSENFVEAQKIFRDLESGSNPLKEDFAWNYLRRLAFSPPRPIRPGGKSVKYARISQDARSLATFNDKGPIYLSERETGRLLATLPFPSETEPRYVEFKAGDRRLIATAPGKPKQWWIYEVPSGKLVRMIQQNQDRRSIQFRLKGPPFFTTNGPALDGGPPRVDLWEMSPDASEPVWIDEISDPSAARGGSPDGRLWAATEADPAAIADHVLAFGDAKELGSLLRTPDRIVVRETLSGGVVCVIGVGTRDGLEWRLSISAAGDVLTAISRERVEFWDVAGRTLLASRKLEGLPELERIRVTADASAIVVAKADGTIEFWDRKTEEAKSVRPDSLKGQHHFYIQMSSDSKTFAEQAYVETENLGGLWEPLRLWDVRRVELLAKCSGYWSTGTFDSTCNYMVIDSVDDNIPEARIWEMRSTPAVKLDGHKDEAWSVAFSPQADLLASGSDDEGGEEPLTIKLWDTKTGGLVRGWHGGEGTVASLAFSPDGATLASAHMDMGGEVRLWNVATGERIATLTGHTSRARCVEYSGDGTLLASCSNDSTILIWRIRDRACIKILRTSDRLRDVAFLSDGKRLASAGFDYRIQVWDLGSGEPVRELTTGSMKMAYSPKRNLIAASQSGEIHVWDAITGLPNVTIETRLELFAGAAFTRGGEAVVVTDRDNRLSLWDVESRQELLQLGRHDARVNGLAFSPDGRALASCSLDGAVWIWRAFEP